MAWIPNVTQRFSRKGRDNENWFEKFKNLRHPPGLSSVPEAGAFPHFSLLFRSVFLFHAAPQLTERLEEARRYALLNREFYVSVGNYLTPYNGRLESWKRCLSIKRATGLRNRRYKWKGEVKRRWKEKDFFFFACFVFLPLLLFSIPLPRWRLNACYKRPDTVLRSGLVAPDKTKI